jgi:probable lipoprotein (TIGR04455 family)
MGAVLLLTGALAGCSVVRSSRVREDWERVDRQRVKRLVVLTQPLPDGNQKVGEMWSAIAARHVDLKRDFIIKERAARSGEGAAAAQEHCADGIEGVLWLAPDVKRVRDGVEAQVEGKLFRCVDGEEVWSASAGGSWDSQEEKLKQTIDDYAAQFGEEVRPYVAASYRLLQDTLDTLPNPVLTEEDQMDKIENAQ